MTDSDDRLLNAVQLAERYGVCRAHIYNLMARGMPSLKVGAARRFRPSEVDAWLLAQQEHQAA